MDSLFLFVSQYNTAMGHTSGRGEGIDVFKINGGRDNGNNNSNNANIPPLLSAVSRLPRNLCGTNPAFFCVDDDQQVLYACNEFGTQSSITAIKYDLQVDPLRLRVERVRTKEDVNGEDPCAITITTTNNNSNSKLICSANYGANGGSAVSVFGVGGDGDVCHLISHSHFAGEKGSNVVTERQQRSHFHCVCVLPPTGSGDSDSASFHFLSADLGCDAIRHFSFTSPAPTTAHPRLSLLSSLRTPPGSGPRHLCLHPRVPGVFYFSCELSSEVMVATFDPLNHNTLSPRIAQRVSSLPADGNYGGGDNYPSHLMCDMRGRFLYCANRGHNSIVRYVIDESTGLLMGDSAEWFPCGGEVPRHFNIDPTNTFLAVANQEGDQPNVSVFRINHRNRGALLFAGAVPCGSPACVQFVVRGKENGRNIKSKL